MRLNFIFVLYSLLFTALRYTAMAIHRDHVCLCARSPPPASSFTRRRRSRSRSCIQKIVSMGTRFAQMIRSDQPADATAAAPMERDMHLGVRHGPSGCTVCWRDDTSYRVPAPAACCCNRVYCQPSTSSNGSSRCSRRGSCSPTARLCAGQTGPYAPLAQSRAGCQNCLSSSSPSD